MCVCGVVCVVCACVVCAVWCVVVCVSMRGMCTCVGICGVCVWCACVCMHVCFYPKCFVLHCVAIQVSPTGANCYVFTNLLVLSC